MQTLKLNEVDYKEKTGDLPVEHNPNVFEDCFLEVDGKVIGFYLKKIPKKLSNLLSIANNEFISDSVPKSMMQRTSGVKQYSTIIGAVPPNTRFGRNYVKQSDVHRIKSAEKFVKAMLIINMESEKLIKKYTPEIYKTQKKIMSDKIKKKWRIGDLYTSSINNANIAADYHQDKANVKNTVNTIFIKKKKSLGGNLHVPKYNATINCCNDSMLVYPAWRDMHGVTPIKADDGGYRNSFVFYPLEAVKQGK